MNAYEVKQEERRERFLELASKNSAKSSQSFDRGDRIADAIPFGQPILVGHHSEKHHRADLDRIHNSMRQGVELAKKAEYYEQRAESVGKGGISSDDPDAVEKLREKLKKMENTQDMMKYINKVHASFLKDPSSLENANLPEKHKEFIRTYKPQYSWEPHTFAPYQFQNNNGNMRRVRERIVELEKEQERPKIEKEYSGFQYLEEDNRAQFIFPGKPDEETRSFLKKMAFKWSPTRNAWVRQLTGYGRHAAQVVIEHLEGKKDE